MGALDDLAAATERAIEETPGLAPMPHEAVPPGAGVKPREERAYVVLVDGDVNGRECWFELGEVAAFNRAGAIEQAEKRWPKELDGEVEVQLIPGRFWQAVVPEEQPPPPPKRKWKGL